MTKTRIKGQNFQVVFSPMEKRTKLLSSLDELAPRNNFSWGERY
jgi:hypothetical protein